MTDQVILTSQLYAMTPNSKLLTQTSMQESSFVERDLNSEQSNMNSGRADQEKQHKQVKNLGAAEVDLFEEGPEDDVEYDPDEDDDVPMDHETYVEDQNRDAGTLSVSNRSDSAEEFPNPMANQENDSDVSNQATNLVLQKPTDEKRPRKFICRYCNKAFSLMNVLKVHERIHTGEKPYICEICNKAFNQSGSLNRHKNTHTKRSTDNRSYSCRFCPCQFLHASQLQDHESIEHSVEISMPDLKIPISRIHNNTSLNEDSNTSMSNLRFLNSGFVPSPLQLKSLPDSFKPSIVISSVIPGSTITNTNSTKLLSKEEIHPIPKLGTGTDKFDALDRGLDSRLLFPCNFNLMNKFVSGLTNLNNSSNENMDTNDFTKNSFSNGRPSKNVKQDHSPKNLNCTMCSMSFDTKSELELHLGQHFLQHLESQFNLGTNGLPGLPNSSKGFHPLNGLNISNTPASMALPLLFNNNFPSVTTSTKADLYTNSVEASTESKNVSSIGSPISSNSILGSSLSKNSSMDPTTNLNSTTNTIASNLNPSGLDHSATAAAAASAAVMAALSQLLLTGPGSASNIPNSNLLAATAALTNSDLINGLINPILPTVTQSGPLNDSAVNFPFNPLLRAMASMTNLGPEGLDNLINMQSLIDSNQIQPDCLPRTPQALNYSIDKNMDTTRILSATPLTQQKQQHQNGFSSNKYSVSPPINTVSSSWSRTCESDFSSSKSLQSPSNMKLDNPMISSADMDPKPNLYESPSRILNIITKASSTTLSSSGFDPENGSDMDGSSATDSYLSQGTKSFKRKRCTSPTSSNKVQKCSFCSKEFNCSSALRIHYRKHSGERPYICRHCGKAFSQNGTLKRHHQTCKAAYSDELREQDQQPKQHSQAKLLGSNNHESSFHSNHTYLSHQQLSQHQQKHNHHHHHHHHQQQQQQQQQQYDPNSLGNDERNQAMMLMASTAKQPGSNLANLDPFNFPVLCDPIEDTTDSEPNSGRPDRDLSEEQSPRDSNDQLSMKNESKDNNDSRKPVDSELRTNNLGVGIKGHETTQKMTSLTRSGLDEPDGSISPSDQTYTSENECNWQSQISHEKLLLQTRQSTSFLSQGIKIEKIFSQFLSKLQQSDLENIDTNIVANLFDKLRSAGKIHGCSDCNTYFFDKKLCNFHLCEMHATQPGSGRFECAECGLQEADNLQFLTHFVRCHRSVDSVPDLHSPGLTSATSSPPSTESNLSRLVSTKTSCSDKRIDLSTEPKADNLVQPDRTNIGCTSDAEAITNPALNSVPTSPPTSKDDLVQ